MRASNCHSSIAFLFVLCVCVHLVMSVVHPPFPPDTKSSAQKGSQDVYGFYSKEKLIVLMMSFAGPGKAGGTFTKFHGLLSPTQV